MKFIDAENLILGRLASNVAKSLLNGDDVIIVNAEKAVLTGSKRNILERYRFKRTVGSVRKGPNYPRMPDRMLRRTVRGMLPIKTSHGKEAYKKLKVYISVPREFREEKFEKYPSADRLNTTRFMSLGDVSRQLGAKFDQ